MTTLTKASHQWMSRPDEERFVNLTSMLKHTQDWRAGCFARTIPNRDIKAMPVEDDHKALALVTNGAPVIPSHHAFGQMATLIGAPAGYLRTLPSPMVADLLNYGLLSQRNVQEIGTLAHYPGDDTGQLMAATGPNYGRVWNDTIIEALISRFGDGITGDFTVPGEFGRAVEVDKANTTLYRSDRDMFVFLADEKNRIEVPNRRNGQPGSLARGFFVQNSEVGAASLKISTFLFDYVCSNRMVWGAKEYAEFSIRHTSGAPHRWIEEAAPALEAYAVSSTRSITDAIAAAQSRKIGKDEDDLDKFLKARFTTTQATAIKLAHLHEEDRPIETIWDAVTATTAYARGMQFQDSRVMLERQGGKLLDLVS